MADLWTSKLSEYIDGTLSAADRLAIERHLVDCAECRVILADLQTVVTEASALTDTPPTRPVAGHRRQDLCRWGWRLRSSDS